MNERNEVINKLLERADIREGMRVLDIGCATGEVTQLISERVGAQGEVIGIDMNEDLLAKAIEGNAYQNVSYQLHDIYQLPETLGQFDAIVGRRVLMYLPDVKQALSVLKGFLKPGGQFCFQESDAINGGTGADQLPNHQTAIQWIWDTVEKEGGDIHIGQKLYQLFNEIGMRDIDYFAEAVIHTSENNDLEWLVGIMLPRMKAHQVVEEDFSIDTFKDKLNQESNQNPAAFIRDMAFAIIGKIKG